MPCATGTSSLTLYLVLNLLKLLKQTCLNQLVYCCSKLAKVDHLTMVDLPTCLGIHDPCVKLRSEVKHTHTDVQFNCSCPMLSIPFF